MKALILFLIITGAAYGQSVKDLDKLEWKPIKEMSGPFPNHPGITVEVFASEIARRDDGVRLRLRFDFPWGSPVGAFQGKVPHGFDPSSIQRVEAQVDFNCKTLTLTPVKKSAEVTQFNGHKTKSKEPPFAVTESHVFGSYFCERGDAPKIAPTLKPKP
jgi:hypothetical protein